MSLPFIEGISPQQMPNRFILTSIANYGGFHEKNSTINRDFWLDADWVLFHSNQYVYGQYATDYF
jgi:hypothetical protein